MSARTGHRHLKDDNLNRHLPCVGLSSHDSRTSARCEWDNDRLGTLLRTAWRSMRGIRASRIVGAESRLKKWLLAATRHPHIRWRCGRTNGIGRSSDDVRAQGEHSTIVSTPRRNASCVARAGPVGALSATRYRYRRVHLLDFVPLNLVQLSLTIDSNRSTHSRNNKDNDQGTARGLRAKQNRGTRRRVTGRSNRSSPDNR